MQENNCKKRFLRRESKVWALCMIALCLIMGCHFKKTLSPEEVKQIEGMKAELNLVSAEIKDAEERNKQYSGGLIKGLISARLEVLKTTKALIEQRIQAIESGAPVTTVTTKTTIDQARADQINSEIENSKDELERAKQEASMYSGGLVYALKQSAVATQEQTLAMLRQQYAIAKFGLGMVPLKPPQSLDDSSHQASIPTTRKEEEPEKGKLIAADGPFGLAMGMRAEQFEGMLNEIEEGLYELKNPPRPHTSFETYILKICSSLGLSWIKAVGKDIQTNSYGVQVKGAFSEMESKLDEKYGKGKKRDMLLPGSIWDEPKDWMMGLKEKDRVLIKIWNKESGANLPDDLSMVGLIAVANRTDVGFIGVEYSFKNKDLCDKEIASKKDQAL